jgi:hypothetical protein
MVGAAGVVFFRGANTPMASHHKMLGHGAFSQVEPASSMAPVAEIVSQESLLVSFPKLEIRIFNTRQQQLLPLEQSIKACRGNDTYNPQQQIVRHQLRAWR